VRIGFTAPRPHFVVTWVCHKCCAGWEVECSVLPTDIERLCLACGAFAERRGLRAVIPL
jgi:hypothetical protein